MAESESAEEPDIVEEQQQQGPPTPVCIKCMAPTDPRLYYCPHCGEVSGQLTQYLPFVNIRWQVTVWGRMWRQVFSHEVSVIGRLFRFIMIVWNVPIMLIGLLFIRKPKAEKPQPPQPHND